MRNRIPLRTLFSPFDRITHKAPLSKVRAHYWSYHDFEESFSDEIKIESNRFWKRYYINNKLKIRQEPDFLFSRNKSLIIPGNEYQKTDMKQTLYKPCMFENNYSDSIVSESMESESMLKECTMMMKLKDEINNELEIHFIEKAEQKYWKNVFKNSINELKNIWDAQNEYLEREEQKYWKNVFMNSMDELKNFWRDQNEYLILNNI